MKKFEGLFQLEHGMKVIARFARRDNEAGDAPDWTGPREVSLHVQRRENELRRGRRVYPAGEVVVLAIKEYAWAEYSEQDYCGNGEFLVEEYRMQILGILE